MTKILKKVFGGIFLFLILGSVGAYSPTNADIKIVDTLSEKFEVIIQKKGEDFRSKIVSALEVLSKKPGLDERISLIFVNLSKAVDNNRYTSNCTDKENGGDYRISGNFSKDDKFVYYKQYCLGEHGGLARGNGDYLETTNGYFYKSKKINTVGGFGFEAGNGAYPKDQAYAYFEGEVVSSDIENFEELQVTNNLGYKGGSYYAKDSQNVYFRGQKIEKADLNSFYAVDQKTARDKSCKYADGKPQNCSSFSSVSKNWNYTSQYTPESSEFWLSIRNKCDGRTNIVLSGIYFNEAKDNVSRYDVKSLVCKATSLTEIPNEFFLLTNIKNITITMYPDSGIGPMPKNTHEITIPNDIKNLKKLETLYIFDQNIVSISDKIGELNNLRELGIGNNNLTSIPDSIGNLENLEILRLYFNQLESIPHSIGNLTKLKELNLDKNNLTSLPSSIGNLINLKELSIKTNNIDFNLLPKEITNLVNLERFAYSEGSYDLPDWFIEFASRLHTK